MNIEFIYSPNYRKGRRGQKITHLVIHTMQGFYEGTKTWFQNPKSQVSAHYLISKQGDMCQMVKEQDTAWHVCNANDFCVGIELEDSGYILDARGNKKMVNSLDYPGWYKSAEINALVDLAADICHRNGIPIANVIGHNDPFLKQFGNNHQDPGPYFPWSKFRDMLKSKLDSFAAADTLSEGASA